ncbi:glycine zipper family protein [Oryzomonas sp.]|uniref:glycine zipper family protein n=1 Tax=Oryzomonas sp. TaxID=2855186 RepID=UPI0038D4F3E3
MLVKFMRMRAAIAAVLVVSGCATMPSGPSVLVLPGPGKSFEHFQADDDVCRRWAERRIGITAQQAANENTAKGAAVGTVIGAGAGALLGAATGHAGAGAAIGAGSGLLVGTAAGAGSGQEYGWQAQQRYDYAYVQCMYSKGNDVPGAVHHYRIRKRNPPPPPPSSVPPDYVPPR